MTKTDYLINAMLDFGRNSGRVYLMSERYRPEDYGDINGFLYDVCKEYQDIKGDMGFNILIELNQLAYENDKKELASRASSYSKLYRLDYDYANSRFTGDYVELLHQESNVENDECDEYDVDDSDGW